MILILITLLQTAKKICGLIGVCSSTSLTKDNLKNILAPSIVRTVFTHEKMKKIIASKGLKNMKHLNKINDILAPGAVRNIKLNSNEGKTQNTAEVKLLQIKLALDSLFF